MGQSRVTLPRSHGAVSEHAHPPFLPHELTMVGLPTQIASPSIQGSECQSVEAGPRSFRVLIEVARMQWVTLAPLCALGAWLCCANRSPGRASDRFVVGDRLALPCR